MSEQNFMLLPELFQARVHATARSCARAIVEGQIKTINKLIGLYDTYLSDNGKRFVDEKVRQLTESLIESVRAEAEAAVIAILKKRAAEWEQQAKGVKP